MDDKPKRSQNLIGFVNDLEVISKKYEKLPGLITTNSLIEFIKLGEFGLINQLDKKAKEISIKEDAIMPRFPMFVADTRNLE